jgi:dTDP-4-dehydrorhamnose reductase
MRTLVFGKTGQVAQSLVRHFPEALFIGRDQADFENPKSLIDTLERSKPQLVINAVAYTDVDRAEIEPSLALRINSESPFEIACWCKTNGASMLHFSTDYVYSGEGERPWLETDPVGPKNHYGRTKLEGEFAIRESGCHSIILRTSWIYSPVGKNFVRTMLRLGQERDSLRVVCDQVGAPTYAPDLADAVSNICRHPRFLEASDIFNLANTGTTSWHGFAVRIFARLREMGLDLKVKNVDQIPSREYATPACRPMNSRLNLNKIKCELGVEPRSWEAALEDCLEVLLSPEVKL